MGRFLPVARDRARQTSQQAYGALAPFGAGLWFPVYRDGVFIPQVSARHRIQVVGGGAHGDYPGQSSSFASLISATGGGVAAGLSGGAGGIGIGGEFQASGGRGGDGVAVVSSGQTSSFGGGGGGAGSPLGHGGRGADALALPGASEIRQSGKAGAGGAVGRSATSPLSATDNSGASAFDAGLNAHGLEDAEPANAAPRRHLFDGFNGGCGRWASSPRSVIHAGSGAGGVGVAWESAMLDPSMGGVGGGGGGGHMASDGGFPRTGAGSLLGGGGGGYGPGGDRPLGGGGGGGYAWGVFDLIAGAEYPIIVAGGLGAPGVVIVEW